MSSWRLPFTELCRRFLVGNGSFVLEFHGIARQRYPELPSGAVSYLSAEELQRILRWLGERYQFLPPEAFLEPGGPPPRSVLLTFDDGLANNAENALPILEEAGAPAVFFVATGHVGEPSQRLHTSRSQEEACGPLPQEVATDLFAGMSREQLEACAKSPLITLGGHTESHPRLSTCDRSSLESELLRSKGFLEEVSGQKVDLFAYPSGDYDLCVAKAVRAAGYQAAFAEDSLRFGIPRFEIPRVGLYNWRPDYLSAKLCGLHRRPLRRGDL
ncbi:MAG: polysaccharide deacetylase family protein [Deltaproteobacteria bacterium]|nr:polysaccharide deacetylase family protein [Deltaproteobacteria bacterium]